MAAWQSEFSDLAPLLSILWCRENKNCHSITCAPCGFTFAPMWNSFFADQIFNNLAALSWSSQEYPVLLSLPAPWAQRASSTCSTQKAPDWGEWNQNANHVSQDVQVDKQGRQVKSGIRCRNTVEFRSDPPVTLWHKAEWKSKTWLGIFWGAKLKELLSELNEKYSRKSDILTCWCAMMYKCVCLT